MMTGAQMADEDYLYDCIKQEIECIAQDLGLDVDPDDIVDELRDELDISWEPTCDNIDIITNHLTTKLEEADDEM